MKYAMRLIVILLLMSAVAMPSQKNKRKHRPVSSGFSPSKDTISPRVLENKTNALSVPPMALERLRFTRYRINTHMGMSIFKGSAFVSAIQWGTNLSEHSPYFFGPEVNFSLYTKGSLLGVLAGGWREWRSTAHSKLSWALGILGGAGFTSGLEGVPTTVLNMYFDTSLSQEIDDLSVVRAHFRPGIVGRSFAFMMAFSVGFRL